MAVYFLKFERTFSNANSTQTPNNSCWTFLHFKQDWSLRVVFLFYICCLFNFYITTRVYMLKQSSHLWPEKSWEKRKMKPFVMQSLSLKTCCVSHKTLLLWHAKMWGTFCLMFGCFIFNFWRHLKSEENCWGRVTIWQ